MIEPAVSGERVSPLALLHARKLLWDGELAAGSRFKALAFGQDHDAYTAACCAACRQGPSAFAMLEAVVIRGEIVRTRTGLKLLRDVLDELDRHFTARDVDRLAA